MSKRFRSKKWEDEEKQLFYRVLKDYVHILQNQSLTANTNKLKIKAWEEVYRKFNSLNYRKRDLNQLKIQWMGMKKNARIEHEKYKASIKTGGEDRPATPEYAIVERRDFLNPGELTIDYDSDGMKPALNFHLTKRRNSSLESLKDHDYITKITDHYKDNEHKIKMKMAEEKHAIEIEILKENLKSAQLQRQILEAKWKKLSD